VSRSADSEESVRGPQTPAKHTQESGPTEGPLSALAHARPGPLAHAPVKTPARKCRVYTQPELLPRAAPAGRGHRVPPGAPGPRGPARRLGGRAWTIRVLTEPEAGAFQVEPATECARQLAPAAACHCSHWRLGLGLVTASPFSRRPSKSGLTTVVSNSKPLPPKSLKGSRRNVTDDVTDE
jgi:hypothetical protein